MAKDANEMAAEWSRSEKNAAAPVQRPRTGTLSVWTDALSMMEGDNPVVDSTGVLVQVLDGMIVTTDEDGSLEFVTMPTDRVGYACFVRDREG